MSAEVFVPDALESFAAAVFETAGLPASDAAVIGADLVKANLDPAPMVSVDSYHASTNGEDAPGFIRAHPDRIAKVQIADAPGRHEPGPGRYDFRALAGAPEDIRYRGGIGLEYVPSDDTVSGLSWRRDWPDFG